jgi:thymidylate synthase (FAD)
MDINRLNQELYELKSPYLKTIPCLDKGFVKLVDFCGSDQRIVQAARVSYGDGTKSVREDKGLIDYLMRNLHTSPFEQVSFTFHAKMPIFIARQVVRHRTAKLNEISGRYSIIQDEFYVPDESRMLKQSSDNKQGSSLDLIDNPADHIEQMQNEHSFLYANYEDYLESGMAKELARINLPLSTYTEWYWTIDAHNLFHFLKLRLDPHAQYEVRVFAQAKYDLIKPIVPYACESFERHILNGKKFSQDEMEIIRTFLNTDTIEEILETKGWKKSKIQEFLNKL